MSRRSTIGLIRSVCSAVVRLPGDLSAAARSSNAVFNVWGSMRLVR